MSSSSSMRQHATQLFQAYKVPCLLNLLAIVPFMGLTLYIKVATLINGYSAGRNLRRSLGIELLQALFEEPYSSQIYAGLLTEISEILWCFPIAICFFSRNLLRRSSQYSKMRHYLLWLGIFLIILMMDDVFRLTLLLYSYIGWPKAISYFLYGSFACLIIGRYRKIIRETPYAFLLLSAGFLMLSSGAELLPISGVGTPILLEDGSKLLGLINLSIYIWQACKKRILLAS